MAPRKTAATKVVEEKPVEVPEEVPIEKVEVAPKKRVSRKPKAPKATEEVEVVAQETTLEESPKPVSKKRAPKKAKDEEAAASTEEATESSEEKPKKAKKTPMKKAPKAEKKDKIDTDPETETPTKKAKKNYYAYLEDGTRIESSKDTKNPKGSKFIGIHPGQASNKVVSAIIKLHKKEGKPVEDLYGKEIKFYLTEVPAREYTKEHKERCQNKQFHYIGTVNPVDPNPETYQKGGKSKVELEIVDGKVVAVKIPHNVKKKNTDGTERIEVAYIEHRYTNKVHRDPAFATVNETKAKEKEPEAESA